MKQKAMELKLVVRPIVGCLTHSHFWEGPCRAGHLEDMTPEAEKKAADAAFAAAKKTLKQATDEIEFLPAVGARYDEKFVVGEDIFAQIEADMDKVDFFLCMNWRIPKLERYRKPVVILQNGNEGIDFAAYCRSIGVEAYVCMDLQDLNDIAHILWVSKAIANTRALVLTAGGQPTFGIQSLIRDPEILRQKYGFEVVKLPFNAIVPYMDAITDEETRPIAEKNIGGANDVKVNTDWFIKGLGLQGIGRMIWLNQAVTTFPKPRCVLEAQAAALSAPPEGQFRGSAAQNGNAFDRCRENLGRLLGIADADRIYFTSGATDAANALVNGLPLAGKRVLATQTEHNSVLRPLMNLTDRVGRVEIVPCDPLGRVDPADVARMLSRPAAALFVNHCSNVTGMVQDIPALMEIAHRHGALLVLDASQSAGCLPVDADVWSVDALIFTGHKALFGPQGTGGYYVRPGVPIRPFRFGGTGRNSRRLTYDNGDYEYEVGTQNAPGIAALNAGVEYVLERGVNAIHAKERGLMKALYEGLASVPGVTLYGDHARCHGPLLSFNIHGLTPSDVAYILSGSCGITVRAGHHCSPLVHAAMGTSERGTVRVSVSDLNTQADIAALIAAVREISSSMEAAT